MVNMSVPTLLSFLVPSFTFLSPRLSHLFTSPGRHRSIFVILSTLSYFLFPSIPILTPFRAHIHTLPVVSPCLPQDVG